MRWFLGVLNVWVFDKDSLMSGVLKTWAEQMGVNVHQAVIANRNFSDQFLSEFKVLGESIDYIVLILGQDVDESSWLSQEWLEALKVFSHRQNIPIIIQSSAAVFTGESSYLFTELDTPVPSSAYGKYCLSVEHLFLDHERSMVLRTGWLYSEHPLGWLMGLMRDVENGNPIDFPADQFVQPTSCHDFARVLVAIMEQLTCCDDPLLWSTYHYASADQVSKNRFCQFIMNEMGIYIDVSASTLESTPFQGRQVSDFLSQYSVIDCTKVLSTFGIKQRAWKKEITSLITSRFSEVERKS